MEDQQTTASKSEYITVLRQDVLDVIDDYYDVIKTWLEERDSNQNDWKEFCNYDQAERLLMAALMPSAE